MGTHSMICMSRVLTDQNAHFWIMMLMMFLSQKIVQAHEQVENFHYTPYLRLSQTMRIKHPVYSEFSGFCNSLLERKMFITFIYKKRIYYFIEIGLFICHKWLKHCLESKNSTEASGGGNVLTQHVSPFSWKTALSFLRSGTGHKKLDCCY